MKTVTCQEIIQTAVQSLGSGFSCYLLDQRMWIVSPYSYPDGDRIEIAVHERQDGTLLVTDLGETLRHLACVGYDPLATVKGEYLVREVLKQHEADLDRGMIFKTARSSELGQTVQDVLMACYSIGHLVFLSRGYRPATFVEEVAHFVTEQGFRVIPHHVEIGQSQRRYDIHLAIETSHGLGLLQALTAHNQGGAKRAVEATVTMWFDIGNGRWFGTVLDDRLIDWKPSDQQLLARVSHVYLWSQRDERLLPALRELRGANGRRAD